LSTNENLLPETIHQAGKLQQVSNRKFLDKLKRTHPTNLDNQFQDVHDEVFEKTDCLACGNCCRTTSPIFNQKDIEHLSKRLRLKPAVFIANYIRMDEDDDFVLKSSPCPFLSDDNSCGVYEDRPTACRTYPHTNRKRIHQLLDLTYQNSFICPAVQQILEKLKVKLGFKTLDVK
jgi:Fe-S-cluster containining protein